MKTLANSFWFYRYKRPLLKLRNLKTINNLIAKGKKATAEEARDAVSALCDLIK
jgi:hypothetical protein